MGLKGLMTGLGVYDAIGLVLSFSAFVAIVVWTCTRPRKEIEAQSRLWEDD
jgi:hypothetical protein